MSSVVAPFLKDLGFVRGTFLFKVRSTPSNEWEFLFTGSGETFACGCTRKLNRDQRFHLTFKWTKTANQGNRRVLTPVKVALLS